MQLHSGFGFAEAARQVRYFSDLGLSHLYLSPILTARSGSTHGYDVVDCSQVNPELGGEAGLRDLVAELRAHQMGIIVDVVPNHMAVGRADNAWWQDVLEWGRDSLYATFFDIDWDAPDPSLKGRVLAPFLGLPYGEALAAGEINLTFDAVNGRFAFTCFEHHFPLAPAHYAVLLHNAQGALVHCAQNFRRALAANQGRASQRHEFERARQRLAQLISGGVPVAPLLDAFSPHNTDSRERLHRLLERQHYRLAWWRTASDEINWRRFFDVTDLAGLRVQETAVFESVHAKIFELYAQGLIDGLRVDHIDGLAQPRDYCRRLRARLNKLAMLRPAQLPRERAYIIVEKILATGEELATDWQTDGTTGYDFMNEVSAVLHNPAGEALLRELWGRLSGRSGDFAQEERAARWRIPQELLYADFNACALALHRIARSDPATRDWGVQAIRRVLAELLVHFPVYRIYADGRGRSAADDAVMQTTLAAAGSTCRPADRKLLPLLDRWLGGEPARAIREVTARRLRVQALARFQQLTSPVAAKSVEDTAFYRHGALLSRNEVGANPNQFSIEPHEFHASALKRRRSYPKSLLATATHDHKRGEDLRARLAVISEVPQQWSQQVQAWMHLNATAKSLTSLGPAPDAADEYMLYQMIVGAWPMQLAPGDAAGLAQFAQRLAVWQRKATREAKRQSGWLEPQPEYEQAAEQFLLRILDPAHCADFLGQIHAFVQSICAAGAVNGLTQTLLRLTSSGVPDLYQGGEYWDLSLVDPDNRRPVNFTRRAASLAQATPQQGLLNTWRDGRIKQHLIAQVLALRKRVPDLFAAGSYAPLRVQGPRARHLLAFVREAGGKSMLVVAPRFTCALRGEGSTLEIPAAAWGATTVLLPKRLQGHTWNNALAPEEPALSAATLSAAQLFKSWPVCLLTQ